MHSRHTAAAMAAAAALGLLTACGGTDNKPATTTAGVQSAPPADVPASVSSNPDGEARAALTKAVQDYTAALFEGDVAGYDALSARCKKAMPKGTWLTMATAAHHDYGSQKATNVKVDQLAGDLARVSYGAGSIPQFDRTSQSWTREGGTWRWDACPSNG